MDPRRGIQFAAVRNKMSAEKSRGRPAALWLTLGLLILPLSTAHPTTTPAPDVTTSSPRQLWCESLAWRCWSTGGLPLAGGCWEPLTRGPCAEGYWVALDLGPADPSPERAPPNGHCAARPCPVGCVPIEERCVSEDEASAALCGGQGVHLDPKGFPRCGDFPGWTSALAALVSCQVPSEGLLPPAAFSRIGPVLCAQQDDGNCGKDVLRPVTGGGVIQPEDF